MADFDFGFELRGGTPQLLLFLRDHTLLPQNLISEVIVFLQVLVDHMLVGDELLHRVLIGGEVAKLEGVLLLHLLNPALESIDLGLVLLILALQLDQI